MLRLQGIEVSNYSLEELAVRFKRSPTYLCSVLTELEDYGYMGGELKGSNEKYRWITCEAFSMLDTQNLSQIVTQSEPILYNNLSDPDHDQIQITKEAQNCREHTIEEELDRYLEAELVPPIKQKKIKKAIRATPIGPVRRESVIRRVIHASKKAFIGDKLAYFLMALKKEMRDLQELTTYLAKNGGKQRNYNLDNLDELGCLSI
jgi:hypothetical protein